MINLVKEQNPMPEQAPDVRNKNFLEVAEGYTEEMAIREAMRCLKCRKKPCVSGCPVNIKIPDFIAQIAIGEFEEAYQIISEDSSLPAICGRVCPQENQCQGVCTRCAKGEPVAIGRLERFAADWHAAHYGDEEIPPVESNGHKVAIIGAGPAGLACAGDLVNKGYEVTVFEALHKTGGVLVYGIPQFRLPKEIVAAEVSKLEAKGVKFVTDAVVGRAITVDELMKEEGFESVFIGTGAGLPSFMNIPGENLIGVCSANEYLTRINLMKAYLPEYDTPIMHGDRIAVVGGEVHHAIEEGCIFKLLHNPVQILGDEDGNVKAIECVQMELGEPDASGRRRPIPIEGSNFEVPVDMVIMSIGTKLNTLILDTTDQLEANKRGGIGTDDAAATNRDGIFAGGDAVTGAATVIKAMGAGKVAAASMDEYLSK